MKYFNILVFEILFYYTIFVHGVIVKLTFNLYVFKSFYKQIFIFIIYKY